MVDPIEFTNYHLKQNELEEYILFSIAVAGKTALTTANNLERLLQHFHKVFDLKWMQPFTCLRNLGSHELLADTMKAFGFGCYNLKAQGFLWMANSGLDLKTCSVDDLEECPGIGLKTSRFFVLHTRKDTQCACLDTHILKWLRRLGYPDIPKVTPTSKKTYKRIEGYFLDICKERDTDPATLDLAVWNEERTRTQEECGV